MSRLAPPIPGSLSLRSMDAFFEPLFARSIWRAGFHEIITDVPRGRDGYGVARQMNAAACTGAALRIRRCVNGPEK